MRLAGISTKFYSLFSVKFIEKQYQNERQDRSTRHFLGLRRRAILAARLLTIGLANFAFGVVQWVVHNRHTNFLYRLISHNIDSMRQEFSTWENRLIIN